MASVLFGYSGWGYHVLNIKTENQFLESFAKYVPIKAVQIAEVKSIAFTIRVVQTCALSVLARPLRAAPPEIHKDLFGGKAI